MDKRELEQILYSYPYVVAENKNIKLELERMEIQGVKPVSYDFKPKSHSKGSVVEEEVIHLDATRQALEGKYRQNEILIEKIENSLSVLDENEREIIKRIYFKRYKSKDIAQQLYLTHIYVSILKKTALNKLMQIFK